MYNPAISHVISNLNTVLQIQSRNSQRKNKLVDSIFMVGRMGINFSKKLNSISKWDLQQNKRKFVERKQNGKIHNTMGRFFKQGLDRGYEISGFKQGLNRGNRFL